MGDTGNPAYIYPLLFIVPFTNEPEPIIVLSEILAFLPINEFAPIHTWLPICIS